MLTLAGKLLLRSSFVFICFMNTTIVAQPGFIYSDCAASGNFTRNTTYERNLDANLAALPTTNSGFGFFNRSTGQGTDRVNSIALCRGDVNADVCQSCLNDSIVKLREICPTQKEAIGYYDYCLLRYSNQTILGNPRGPGALLLFNTQNASDRAGFSGALRPLMDQLRLDAAAGGPLIKFATGNATGPDFATIYGLVQCTPDLTVEDCSSCLEGVISQFTISYSAAIGGQALLPMCKFRYEINRFYNQSTLVIPPPLPPPRPLPPPPPLPPGKKTNTTRTVIIVIVIVILSIIIIIASICIFMRSRRKKQQIPPTENTENHRAGI